MRWLLLTNSPQVVFHRLCVGPVSFFWSYRLEQELDFIFSQTEELDELLQPLEAGVVPNPGSFSGRHADRERERT